MFKKLLGVRYITRYKDGCSYHAIEVCNFENGMTAKAQVNHCDNVQTDLFHLLGEDWSRTYETKVELKSRDYHAFVKDAAYIHNRESLREWLALSLDFRFDAKLPFGGNTVGDYLRQIESR